MKKWMTPGQYPAILVTKFLSKIPTLDHVVFYLKHLVQSAVPYQWLRLEARESVTKLMNKAELQ